MFFQPALEQALARRASEQPSVTVERGWVAQALSVEPEGAVLTLRRVSEERDLARARSSARSAHAGSSAPTAPTPSFARRAASPAATSAFRSAGSWST